MTIAAGTDDIYLTNGAPDFRLNRRIHFLLLDGETDEMIENLRYFVLLRIIVQFTKS